MLRLLIIGCGGFLGSVSRFLVGAFVQGRFGGAAFPWGTLAVNALGCLLIGAVSQLAEGRGLFGDYSRSFLVIGVLGGFTTFSAFGNETANLLRDGQLGLAALNAVAQVTLGLLCVFLGRLAVLWLWR